LPASNIKSPSILMHCAAKCAMYHFFAACTYAHLYNTSL